MLAQGEQLVARILQRLDFAGPQQNMARVGLCDGLCLGVAALVVQFQDVEAIRTAQDLADIAG